VSTVPVLTRVPPDDEHYDETGSRIIVGTDLLLLDGEPFPWLTVGDWTMKFTEDGVATLNVSIVVTLPVEGRAR